MKNTLELYGKIFDIVRKAPGFWQTEYNTITATSGRSRSEAIAKLEEYDRAKIIAGCDSIDKGIKRDAYFREHEQEFTQIFGFAPPRDFIRCRFGCGLSLDVIALDQELHTPDGVSTSNYIRQKFGDRALELTVNMT